MNGHLITKLMVAIFFYVTIWKPSFNIICIRLLFYLQGIQHDLNYLHYFNLLLIDSVHIYTKMFIFTAKLHFKMLEFFVYLSGISGERVISTVGDLCASLQYAIAFQICRRLQRAFSYCELQGLLPENSTLVGRC